MTVLVAGCWFVVEVIVWLALCFNYGGLEAVQQLLDRQAQSATILGLGRDPRSDSNAYPDEIVHPYLGYVRHPLPSGDGSSGVSEFGFPGQLSPIRKRQRGQVLVGISGGSVAEYLTAEAGDRLRELLEKSPRYSGKQIVLVPLGLLSFKQPQQLMTLNYLLSQGAEFDVWINLDGYNEIVLPAVFNVPNHVYASYPREWHLRVTRATDLETLRLVGRIAYLREQTRQWADRFARSALRFSPTAMLVWIRMHGHYQGEATLRYKDLNTRMSRDLDVTATGPAQAFANEAERLQHCVDVWRRSSQLMHAACQANGIVYYHFLQPNQYQPGSKPLSEQERRGAIDANHTGKPLVEQGFPKLIAAGETLKAQSVRFHDLTQVFAHVTDSLYRDTCCHVNGEGNRLLAEAIAQVVGSKD